MESKTIKLLKPLRFPGRETIEVITLRAPNYNDFVELGEPEIYVPMREASGGLFQPDFPVIRRYIERLMPPSLDPNVLGSASLADAIKLKNAVLSFFHEAMVSSGDWTTPGTPSPEGSSSPTASKSEASAS